jgi:hypothetical protein
MEKREKNVVLNEITQKEKYFEELARPIIQYLCENFHPHVTVIITPTHAELLEGKMVTGKITDYICD